MSSTPSKFVWYELMTTDPQAAEAFYRTVMGWQTADAGMPGMQYTILSVGSNGVGGLMALPADALAMGARPGWSGYISVDDVDAAAARIVQAGGAVHHPATDIPGVGRFAAMADPQGAGFVLFKPAPGDMPTPPAPGTPGHVGWHELHAAEEGPAFAFYAAHFGWTEAEAMDMGAMGIYRIFAIDGVQSGGMMTRTPDTPVPCWLYYFNTDDIEAAAQRVRDNAGQVNGELQQVPGGSWIANCSDPQGAMFALVGPKA